MVVHLSVDVSRPRLPHGAKSKESDAHPTQELYSMLRSWLAGLVGTVAVLAEMPTSADQIYNVTVQE